MLRPHKFDRRVYFLRTTEGRSMVKIGCSFRPDDRLFAMQKQSPVRLEIAATMPGDHKLEKRFHAMFLADHSHHEWFRGSYRLFAAIERINRGEFDLAELPPKGVHLYQARPLIEQWAT